MGLLVVMRRVLAVFAVLMVFAGAATLVAGVGLVGGQGWALIVAGALAIIAGLFGVPT